MRHGSLQMKNVDRDPRRKVTPRSLQQVCELQQAALIARAVAVIGDRVQNARPPRSRPAIKSQVDEGEAEQDLSGEAPAHRLGGRGNGFGDGERGLRHSGYFISFEPEPFGRRNIRTFRALLRPVEWRMHTYRRHREASDRWFWSASEKVARDSPRPRRCLLRPGWRCAFPCRRASARCARECGIGSRKRIARFDFRCGPSYRCSMHLGSSRSGRGNMPMPCVGPRERAMNRTSSAA